MSKFAMIYQDEGSSSLGVASLMQAVPQKLGYLAKVVSAEQILQGDLSQAKLLIMPGGRDLPYCEKLNGRGNQLIRKFVAEGGIYLGICAGAYYASRQIEFIGRDYQVFGERELSFFDGIARGSLTDLAKAYDETAQSKACVPLHFAKRQENPTAYYYHGGSAFIKTPETTQRIEVIARYPNGHIAILKSSFGKGAFLLSGVHFELQSKPYQEIVKNAPFSDRLREKTLAKMFTHHYGDEIWQEIRQLIR